MCSSSSESTSYREFFSTLSMFHKCVLVLLSLITFGGGCVTLGIGIGRIQKLEDAVVEVAAQVSITNEILESIAGEGTNWTYSDMMTYWREAQSEHYKNDHEFNWPEPHKAQR